MSAIDPVATVRDALARDGQEPRGPAHKFAARCPGHDDRNASLSVEVGADGRALVHCHAGCDTEQVLAALGLRWADLFPAGHHRARVYQLADARRRDFDGDARQFVNTLAAVLELGGELYGQLRFDCPRCGSPAAVLMFTPEGVSYACPGDETATDLGYTACTLRQFREALAGRLHDRRNPA